MSILPDKKNEEIITDIRWSLEYKKGFNQAITDCQTNLNKAIDKVCDEEVLADLIYRDENLIDIPQTGVANRSMNACNKLAHALSTHIRAVLEGRE